MTLPEPVHGDDWETHWTEYGDSAVANPAQSMRRRLIVRELRHYNVRRVVDIGSGQGDLVVELSKRLRGLELVGLELSASGVEQARTKIREATFVQTNLLEAQAPPNHLVGWGDSATCTEVLEHLDDPVRFLRNALVYVQPGAPVIVTVPAGPRSEFDLFIGHRRHFTPDTLRETLESAGLEIESVSARGFPFFNLYRLLVIARGERVIEDARGTGLASPGIAVRVLFRFFDIAFRIDLRRRGWQLLAVARVPK